MFPDSDAPADALQFIAKSMLANSRGGKKHDARIYWKRPLIDPDTGERDDAPGWVMWASGDTQSTSFMDSMLIYGRTPLPQYGFVDSDKYGSPWGTILSHPKGPSEFPLEQIMAFGWYDPSRVPVAGVRFPQLVGQTVTVYDCPECTNRVYQKPVHLARHLRLTHDWGWEDITAYGQEQDIVFEKERTRGKNGRITFDYADEEFAAEVKRAAAVAEIARSLDVFDQHDQPSVPIRHVRTSVTKGMRDKRGDLSPEQKEFRRQNLIKARAVRAANQAKRALEAATA